MAEVDTIVSLLRGYEILLAMKKRGFGEGRWNGLGGKPNSGESLESAAIREVYEESGIQAQESDLIKLGVIHFSSSRFGKIVSHVYILDNWQGEPIETEEMRPQWFLQSDIPYDEMWPADRYWLPKVLARESFLGEVIFDGEDRVLRQRFSPV